MAIITVSRGTLSGGEVLAACLESRLGYPMIGREVLVAAAEKLGMDVDRLAQKIANSPTLWERMTTDRKFYLVAIQAALAERAVSGNLICHGLAVHLLLPKIPCVLRVRLIAPLKIRTRTVMERWPRWR